MVLRDFGQKIKTSRCRWPGYYGIAQNLWISQISRTLMFTCIMFRLWVGRVDQCRQLQQAMWRRLQKSSQADNLRWCWMWSWWWWPRVLEDGALQWPSVRVNHRGLGSYAYSHPGCSWCCCVFLQKRILQNPEGYSSTNLSQYLPGSVLLQIEETYRIWWVKMKYQ